MERIEVEGMYRLQGEIEIQGSKNAVLPLLAASVLTEGETILHGCPKIKDVSSMVEALECVGAKVKWEGNTLILDTSAMYACTLIEKAGCMRSSVMLLGSFLGRFGKATLGYPGGCCIGKRPIDLHEQVLSAMGAVFCEEENFLEASCERLEGCDLYLPYPSVGVTENILLAASKASGETHIYGAAKEPEIVELCRFLQKMGVKIGGAGSACITIQGTSIKKSVEYEVCSDRIVAGTYLFATAAAGGEVILKNAPLEHMKSTIETVAKLGGKLKRSGEDVHMIMSERPRTIPALYTAPYPRFPTDLQSPLLAVLCKADGNSRIQERIFENRFLIVEELEKMGAKIKIQEQYANVFPTERLYGAPLNVTDLRGGAALVIAALSAEGYSYIQNAELISRGYEDIVRDLTKVGAHIRIFS